MNSYQLLDHFDRISDATDAIPRLRRFILDLAVRGKLVHQDPNDEPANELLKRLYVERNRSTETGRRRTPGPEERDDTGETELFALPSNWVWCALADLGTVVAGGTPPSGDLDNFTAGGSGIAWLTPADLGKQPKLFISHGSRDLTPRGLSSSSATLMPKGSVLFSSRAPIGYVAIAANELCTNQGFKSVVPFVPETNLYIAVYFCAFGTWIDSKASGTTFREVSGKTVSALPFPLAPLAEQHRIVAKVEELLALCDQLEAALAERERRRDRLAAASMQRLNAPTDAPAVREQVGFHLLHLGRMTTRPDQIPALRKCILNLAVRGQLVRQDPEDDPAPAFGITDSADGDDRIDLALPLGWAWARVEDVAEARLGKMLDKAKNTGRPYRYLRNTNVHWFDVRIGDLKELKLEATDLVKYLLRDGDVLICEGGHGIGRTAVWRSADPQVVFQKALHRVRPDKPLAPDFFAFCMFVYFHSKILQTYFTGVGIPHFTGQALASVVFPLPPLAEQLRIVARVEELMAVCDRLEASLISGDNTRRRLVDVLLADALERTPSLDRYESRADTKRDTSVRSRRLHAGQSPTKLDLF